MPKTVNEDSNRVYCPSPEEIADRCRIMFDMQSLGFSADFINLCMIEDKYDPSTAILWATRGTDVAEIERKVRSFVKEPDDSDT